MSIEAMRRKAAEQAKNDLREQVARAIYKTMSGGADPDAEGWESYSAESIYSDSERHGKGAYTALADAALAVATPIIRADERERLAQKVGSDAVYSFVTNEHGGIVRTITVADWIRAQTDEPDDRKIYIGFKDKSKDKDKEDDQ
jgi:hypothetical protein